MNAFFVTPESFLDAVPFSFISSSYQQNVVLQVLESGLYDFLFKALPVKRQ